MRRLAFASFLLGTLVLVAATLCACGGADDTFDIYTSIYPHVIRRMEAVLAKQFPDTKFRWYQMGSEQIAARLSTELEAGHTPCDLLMTSDPFYYAGLAAAGHLLPYDSPATAAVAAGLKDAGHDYATVRVPLMVIAVNHEHLALDQHPRSFKDLADPRFAGKLSMGDPLKSGTTFTTVAALVREYGWPYIEALRDNDVLPAGGNSATLARLETGERPVAIILLENLLPSLAKHAPITVIYPTDGAIPIPSPVAILRTTNQPALAKRVYDFMYSEAMQDAVVSGFMYSPLPSHAPPSGARPWNELAVYAWNAERLAWVRRERDAIKKRFRSIMR